MSRSCCVVGLILAFLLGGCGCSGKCETKNECECFAALQDGTCQMEAEDCWCPNVCDPAIDCACGGGKFIACREPQEVEPVVQEPEPAVDVCGKLMEEFNAIKDKATGKCTVDEDCAMFPILSSCGHVTDKTSSDAARVIREKCRAAKCPGGVRCAPRVRGRPYCNSGVCAEGEPRK
ncbi:MAG: hypothetical protein HN348_30045 [Proteobacteria bacterium]|jgi:hypothetical protein|nr:hypothetical protein [Pseudomonadota bacterium]